MPRASSLTLTDPFAWGGRCARLKQSEPAPWFLVWAVQALGVASVICNRVSPCRHAQGFFTYFDTSADGYIERDEIMTALGTGKDGVARVAGRLFSSLDWDKVCFACTQLLLRRPWVLIIWNALQLTCQLLLATHSRAERRGELQGVCGGHQEVCHGR